ncbi:DUF1674 domain-containing protein [Nevskia sp.]|uniref:DUF1674 domain-containing protein n=1 Tax=Nevskia sp. TaxID=1929292 RepID=UPI0034588A9F
MREFCHTSGVTQTPSNVIPPNPPDASAATGRAPIAAPQSAPEPPADASIAPPSAPVAVPELGGRRDGTDPTRFGDWEKGGRCIDF